MTTTLLRLDSSAAGADSASRRLTQAFAEAWSALPGTAVVHRDLHADPPPHLPSSVLHFPQPVDESLEPARAVQRAYLDELLAADVLLVAVPLYNYSLPSTLKAWIDHVHVPGETSGPTQPLAGRDVVLVGTRGAGYEPGSPTDGWDHALPAVSLVLGTSMGMRVRSVTVDYTLSRTMEQLAEFREVNQAQEEAATASLRALAAELVTGLAG